MASKTKGELCVRCGSCRQGPNRAGVHLVSQVWPLKENGEHEHGLEGRGAGGHQLARPPYIGFTPRQVKPDPTPLLTSRHNVFQNDEFDVFSRDSVDLSRVHKGRR